jgi:hypothetical protein
MDGNGGEKGWKNIWMEECACSVSLGFLPSSLHPVLWNLNPNKLMVLGSAVGWRNFIWEQEGK